MASLTSWLISLIIITLLLASILTPTFLAIFLKNENENDGEAKKVNSTTQTVINQTKIKTITSFTKNNSENAIFYETNGFINNIQGIRISGKNYEDIAVSAEAKASFILCPSGIDFEEANQLFSKRDEYLLGCLEVGIWAYL